MRAGWNERLRAELQRGDSVAGQIAEVVVVADSDIRNTREDWGASTRTNVSIRSGGGVALTPSSTLRASYTTATDPTDTTRLTNGSPFDGILIEWYGSRARNRELRNFTARLHPRVNAGSPKTVAYWVCEVFRVTQIGDDDIRTELHLRREVEAVGEVASDVAFSFSGFNGSHPIVGDPPAGSGTGRPMTVIRIVAIQDDGTIADNVSWVGSSTDGDFDNDPGVYDLWHYTFNDLPGTSGVTSWFFQGDRSDLPRFVLNEATYPDGDVELDGANDFDDLPGSGDLRVVLRGIEPSDTAIRAFIWDGLAYVRCYDGDIVGQDNRVTIDGIEFGGDLSGVPTTGPWNMRVYLDASSDGLNTPTVRDFGLERLSVTPLIGAAKVSGGGQRIGDLTALKGSIADAKVEIAKSGEQDYDDYGSRILSQNHIGQIDVRVWIGDLTGTRLARSEWMLHSAWEVENYDNTASAHVVEVLSPLRRMRKSVPPFVAVGGGPGGERAAVELSATIADAWSEVVDTLAALPGRYVGTRPADEVTTIGDTIRKADAKDLLDAIAYLDGSANIESQGRIKAVRIMHDDPADEAISFQLPIGSYEPGRIGPGFDARTDEFFVRYNWNEADGAFEDERRHANLAALESLGGPGLNTTQDLRDEVSRLIRTEALADAVGRRVPKHFGTGELLWHVHPHERMPHIEIGDVGVIETELFVARTPINGRELRGPLATLAVVVGYDDADGRGLWLWVPSYELIQSTSAAVDRSALPDPDLSAVVRAKWVPIPANVYKIEVEYDLGDDVAWLDVVYRPTDAWGFGTAERSFGVAASGRGVVRLDPTSLVVFTSDVTDRVEVEVTPRTADGGVAGPTVYTQTEIFAEAGAGVRAEATSGGAVLLSDRFVAGTNITIAPRGSDDRIEISAAGGGGGASTLDDLSDVVIASLADDDALMYDSGTADWRNRALTAGDLKTGTLPVARGGTGETSFEAQALLIGLGAGIGEISAGSAGILKSDGVSWSSSVLVAGDIPGLDAAKIITGTFDVARIPNLATTKITSGVFDIARIPSIPVTGLTPGILDSTSWRWRGMDGTEAAPGLAFSSQINTGIRRVTTSVIGFVTAGVDRMRVVTAGAQLLSGSPAAPSLAGLSFTTSGIYWASGVVGLSVSGTSRIRATTTGGAVTGTLTATGDVQSSVSDARLKTDIGPIDRPLERLKQLRGLFYRYTDEALDRWPELSGQVRAGLLADDVLEALPPAYVPFAGDPEYGNYDDKQVLALVVAGLLELDGRAA